MKVLFVLNYYYPYVSGLTEHVRMLAEELAGRGHQVTVLASNHDNLEECEIVNGVRVVRAPIIGKISKGTVSPAFIWRAWSLSRQADIVNLHLPMLESGPISLLIPWYKLVVTYHCDMNLPNTFFNRLIIFIMNLSHKIALWKSGEIVSNTKAYLRHSLVTRKFSYKFTEIFPPIKKPEKSVEETKYLKDFCHCHKIGFCGRITEEKGLDVLIKAFRIVKKEIPDAVLLIGGDYLSVAGGSIYPELQHLFKKDGIQDVYFLGKIPEKNMYEFYSSLDVFVLPSTGHLESFGLVQVEAMLCGTPVVSSDLVGVRSIVDNTGMGLVSRKGDSKDLASCILEVVKNRKNYVKASEEISAIYSTKNAADQYVKLFESFVYED